MESKRRKQKKHREEKTRFTLCFPLNTRTTKHSLHLIDKIVVKFKGCSHSRITFPSSFIGRYKKYKPEQLCYIFFDVDVIKKKQAMSEVKKIIRYIKSMGEKEVFLTYCSVCHMEN